PAQRDVLDRRTPEYVMNMMLNPDEMLKRHPEAKKMFAEYLTPMTNQNLTMDEARAILEYFRVVKNQKK
ncbi:MAG: mS29 family ribosomal protein, partial [Ignavibacteria bacterium]|nr:mS29 family ribosomal protein [Ignavibacteria bacterium]